MNEYYYNKYNQPYTLALEFDEIANDFSQIKPTYKPIVDICILKLFGNFIYSSLNYKLWQVCPDLINELVDIIDKTIISNIEVERIIKDSKEKNDSPDTTIHSLYIKLCNIIRPDIGSANFNDLLDKYFDTKLKYDDAFKLIKLKYQDEWNKLEIESEKVSDIMINNFNDLFEHNQDYTTTMEIINGISDEATRQIKPLIVETVELIKQTFILSSDDNMIIDSIKIFIQLKEEIIKEFEKKIDQIYESIILSKHFDMMIHNVIIELYSIEKLIHNVSLTTEIYFITAKLF